MVSDMRGAIQAWFADLRNPVHAATLAAVRGNLRSFVREQQKVIPEVGGVGGAQLLVQSSI